MTAEPTEPARLRGAILDAIALAVEALPWLRSATVAGSFATADSLEGAVAHGEALSAGGGYRLIEADVPDDAPSLYQLPNLDGRGPARYLDVEDLRGVEPRPLE